MSIVHCLCLPSLTLANSWAPGRRPRTKPLQPQQEQSINHGKKSRHHRHGTQPQSHSHTRSQSTDTATTMQTIPAWPFSQQHDDKIMYWASVRPLSAALDANERPGSSRFAKISKRFPNRYTASQTRTRATSLTPKVRCTRAHFLMIRFLVFVSSCPTLPAETSSMSFLFWMFLLRLALYFLWLIVFSFIIKNKST
jgi:hypothetical protein